jgi:hypothetical protein
MTGGSCRGGFVFSEGAADGRTERIAIQVLADRKAGQDEAGSSKAGVVRVEKGRRRR